MGYTADTMTIHDFDVWAREVLGIDKFNAADSSLNGLQVGQETAPLRTIAFAVDCGLETIQRAKARGAQLLFVHHGLFWGRSERLTGFLYKRIASLIDAHMGLYACHLPLDAHPELGNNAVIARILGLNSVEPFGQYHGAFIGCKGLLPEALSLEAVSRLLLPDGSAPLSMLPFGPKLIRSVGIISGGAASDVLQAVDQGLDLYITGESGHSIYHPVLESGINMLAFGHYSSEVHGVQAVAERVCRDLGLETFFVDVPTGL